MKYFVTREGRTAEVVVDGERVTVDGVTLQATLREIPGTPLRHLVVDGRSLLLAVRSDGGSRWTLLHAGEAVELEALDERTRHIREMVGEGKATGGGGQVRAPMPGLVVRLLVTVGEVVAAGAGLVVLEAMKMENELKAPGPGRVVRIGVAEGEAVEKGAVLVELEGSPADT